MGDHNDFNGNYARWLFCAAKTPLRYLRLLREDKDTGISEALTYLYTELEKVPQQDYLLSYEAMQLLETWQHQLVDAQQCEDAFGLQLAFPKIEAYTARLALWLHVVNAVLRGERPSQAINGDTMEKAIELAAYYLWQYRLIHTHNSPDSGLAAIALKIQKFVERVGNATASALKSGVRDLRKMATDQIRQLMQTLANAGYGCVTGEGASIVYVPTPSNASPSGRNEEGNISSNDQFVNSAAEFPTTDRVDSIDAEGQLKRQLSTAQTDASEDESSQELRAIEDSQMPVLTSEGGIDTIGRELTELSMLETEAVQSSRTSIDPIDTEVESRPENTPPANPTTGRVAKTEVNHPIAGVDGVDASSESANGACLSFGSTPSWNGFKVGDSVMLSYHQTGGRAWVIDPAQYPELGVQPRPNLVPVRCAYTGKAEWYPADWVRLAT